jgi:hypothetical protein
LALPWRIINKKTYPDRWCETIGGDQRACAFNGIATSTLAALFCESLNLPQLGNDLFRFIPFVDHSYILHGLKSHTQGRLTSQAVVQTTLPSLI